MHPKALIFLSILAVLAALLIGINVGRKLNPNQELIPSPSSRLSPLPTTNPSTPLKASNQPFDGEQSRTTQGKPTTFSHPQCGVSFPMPSGFEIDQQASDGAKLVNQTTKEEINLVCSDVLPKPPLTSDQIETASISGVTATIYHDAQAKDGTPVDVVMFVNPENGLEVALLGFGKVFKQVWQQLIFLK